MAYSILRAANNKGEFIFSLLDYADDPYRVDALFSSKQEGLSIIQVSDPTFDPFMEGLSHLVEKALKDICSDESALCTIENAWNTLTKYYPYGIAFD